MADGKWIKGLHASTPLDEAARQVLAARLEVVSRYLPLAVERSSEDIEHVHQLRVGTRRARAAVDIFAVCLPNKHAKKLRQAMRDVRRAAGDARDWDVFLKELGRRSSEASARQRPGFDFLLGYGLGQRRAAQESLVAFDEKARGKLNKCFQNALEAVERAQELKSLSDLGKRWLTDLLAELGSVTAGPLDDYEHLHEVRIVGKRLRYALEVFADAFPPTFRGEIYPHVEAMQEILGKANDSHVAGLRLQGLLAQLDAVSLKRMKPALGSLLEWHRARLPREREAFDVWLREWRAGPLVQLRAMLAPTD